MTENIHAEIERVAYDLYEQSGREEGRDLINWLSAEKIVLGRLAFSDPAEAAAPADKAARRHRGRESRRRNAAS